MGKKITKTILNVEAFVYRLGDDPSEFISKVLHGESVQMCLPEGKGSWFSLGGGGKEGTFGGTPDGKPKYTATINYSLDTPLGKQISEACVNIRKSLGGGNVKGFFKFISSESKSLGDSKVGAEAVSVYANVRASFKTSDGRVINNSPRVFIGGRELSEEQLENELPIGNGSTCSIIGKFTKGTKPVAHIRLNLDLVQFSRISPRESMEVKPDEKFINNKKINTVKELAKLGLS